MLQFYNNSSKPSSKIYAVNSFSFNITNFSSTICEAIINTCRQLPYPFSTHITSHYKKDLFMIFDFTKDYELPIFARILFLFFDTQGIEYAIVIEQNTQFKLHHFDVLMGGMNAGELLMKALDDQKLYLFFHSCGTKELRVKKVMKDLNEAKHATLSDLPVAPGLLMISLFNGKLEALFVLVDVS